MDESGNRSILDMEGFNLIDFSVEDDSLINLLLLEPRTHQSSDIIGNEEKLFPGIEEDDNRSCDSSRMVESETSTSGNLHGDELFEDVRALARKSGQASNVEGSSTEKKLRTKTISATPVKRASLGSKNVKMKESMKTLKSTEGIGAPVLKARTSSGSSRNMASNPPASTKKELKTASSLESGSTTPETLKSPLDSSKGKECLRRNNSSRSQSMVKMASTVASRSRNSADKKPVRSSLSAQRSMPSQSQSVGGLANSAPRSISSCPGKLNRLRTAGLSTSINSNKAVKLTPARKEVLAAPGVGKNLLHSKSKQTIDQGLSNNSSSSLMKKNGSKSFPSKQVHTKCAGTFPFKVANITLIDVGNVTEDMFLVTAEEDDMPKRKSVLPARSHVVTARVPLSSRVSLCNSSNSIQASAVPKVSVVQNLSSSHYKRRQNRKSEGACKRLLRSKLSMTEANHAKRKLLVLDLNGILVDVVHLGKKLLEDLQFGNSVEIAGMCINPPIDSRLKLRCEPTKGFFNPFPRCDFL